MELQELEQFVREKASLRKWDAEGCLRIGAELAVKINSIKNLSGEEKKKLVVDLILKGLHEGEKKEKEGSSEAQATAITARYDQLEKVVKETLPVSLELMISASRGKFDLKKVKPSVLLRYCSCFAKGVVTVLVSQKVISEETAKKVNDAVEKVEDKIEPVAEAADALPETENPMLKIRELATSAAVAAAASEGSSTQESKE
jgi:hypothetical protein